MSDRLVTLALLLALLLPGIVGHDPWKQDEGYTFGVVIEILRTGHWVVPTLAGEPFMEKPPLFYLMAAGTARMLSPWLPLHDGARVAALLCVAIALSFTALSARRLFGKEHGVVATLLAAGCIGLLPHAHELISDTALFAGFAIAIYGFTFATDRPLVAGAIIGTGVGMGFMSKGLVEPAMLGIAALALPCISSHWRTRTYARSVAWSALAAAPWLLAWPMLLYRESPQLFLTWLWTNNFGRYFGFAHLGADTEPWYYTHTLPWFTFPAGPLALWTLLGIGKLTFEARRGVLMLLVIGLSMCAILATASTARALYAIPLLIPLAIMGSVRLRELPDRVGRFTGDAGVLLGSAIALASTSLWTYGILHGRAPNLQVIAQHLPTDFAFALVMPLALAAATLCAIVIACLRHGGATWLHRWTAGMALAWGLPATLLLPWIDNARSFREPFSAMSVYLEDADCVSAIGLGENQRGMLHYISGIRPSNGPLREDECNLALWQRKYTSEPPPRALGAWSLVWAGGRPGEDGERFFLYRAPPITAYGPRDSDADNLPSSESTSLAESGM